MWLHLDRVKRSLAASDLDNYCIPYILQLWLLSMYANDFDPVNFIRAGINSPSREETAQTAQASGKMALSRLILRRW